MKDPETGKIPHAFIDKRITGSCTQNNPHNDSKFKKTNRPNITILNKDDLCKLCNNPFSEHAQYIENSEYNKKLKESQEDESTYDDTNIDAKNDSNIIIIKKAIPIRRKSSIDDYINYKTKISDNYYINENPNEFNKPYTRDEPGILKLRSKAIRNSINNNHSSNVNKIFKQYFENQYKTNKKILGNIIINDEPELCFICCANKLDNDTKSDTCRHIFCKYCVKTYLTSHIINGNVIKLQ